MIHNRKIIISVGNHRKSLNWQPQNLLLSEFYEKLRLPARGSETVAQYHALTRGQQNDLKDMGGYVAGALKGIRRKTSAVLGRDLVTLDFDKIPPNGTDDILRRVEGLGCGYCVYSTRKHSPYAPRLRILLPLDRTATAEEYEAVARKMAELIGLEFADPSTFEPARLMYWPSVCADGEYIYTWQDKGMLEVDGILAQYANWRDISSWPRLHSESAYVKRAMQQGDPHSKPGIVGAFCRTYSIYAAMDEFLPGIYEPCEHDDRYTYTAGSTTGGAVAYDGGLFLYSHHATDPCGGKLVNAFDLVRLHKFEGKDDEVTSNTPVNRLPSYAAMSELALNIKAVKGEMLKERFSAQDDFGSLSGDKPGAVGDWTTELSVDGKNRILQTSANVLTILQNDLLLAGKMALDEFSHREVMLAPLPWRKIGDNHKYLTDTDDAALRIYLEKRYQIAAKSKIDDALRKFNYDNSFHPVKAYILSHKWDGQPRIDTHYIEYMGVADSEYTRAVSRKSFVACVARVFRPGVKFDHVLVLVGDQGRGKSTLIKKIAADWFSDSLTLVQGRDKEAYEQLQGAWIIEFGDLAALKKADIDQIKHFITKTDDRYRVSYGKRVEDFPRQCVFFGTSNTRDFLKDPTGDRRFWPLDIDQQPPTKNVFVDLTECEIGQVWAEAYRHYTQGESIFLSKELEEMARSAQEAHTEENPKKGLIEIYLELDLPGHWDTVELPQRHLFVQNKASRENVLAAATTTFKRNKVCAMEIWCEVFGGNPKDLNRAASLEISNIMRRIKDWMEGRPRERVNLYGVQKCYYRVPSRRADAP